MKYTVKAYLCTNFTGLMDSLETDSFDEAQDFIWDNCQKGHNCEFIDNDDANNCGIAYADLFTENTIGVDELIIHEHGASNFYDDLLMEQQEQM